MQKIGISLENIRLEVEKLVQPGPSTQILGDIPFTPRSKKVLELAAEEARSLGHNYIGTEHLLLGLIREGEGVAIDILVSLGANLYQLKKDIEAIITPSGPVKITNTDNIPLLKTSERILKLVYLEAKSLKKTTIDTGHLLLAIIKDETTSISRVLFDHSVDYEKVKRELCFNKNSLWCQARKILAMV